MNINDSSAFRSCSGCQMCAAVCARNAIRIELNDDGFYRPSVDVSACVDCGLCVKVCYKFDDCIKNFDEEKLSSTVLYGASAKNMDVLENSTSGGVADLLAHKLTAEGYKCVGVVYDSSRDCAVDCIAANDAELLNFRGSKYIQSYTLDAFKSIVQTCASEKYAVFGTPCHIYSLDRYLRHRKVRDNFVLVDLYCHGCPSMNLWKKYVNEIKHITGEKRIDNANFRSKVHGWGTFYVVVVVVDGKPVYYSKPNNNDFFELFFSDQILNEACNSCKLRSTLAYTDIRLGDFWGKQYVLNNKGVSAVSLVTERAKRLFEDIVEELDCRKESYNDFLPWQSWGKEHHPDKELRERLLEQLRDDSVPLRESVRMLYSHQSLKGRLIRVCKKMVHLMPVGVEKKVRWLFYKL